MTLFLVLIFSIYFWLTATLMLGYQKALAFKILKSSVSDDIPSTISVIVPFKNEEVTILRLIRSLQQQDFPIKRFEVILVDDHSTDKSILVVYNEIKSLSNFKMILAEPNEKGKKHALDWGIHHAKGAIIATTDADCMVPSQWLTKINNYFMVTDAKMIFGGVRIEENKSFFSKLQAIEFSSLIGSGAATLALGYPSMCNGANLAFYKKAFIAVGGYKDNYKIASGDDEFLMRKIYAHFSKQIFFMNDPGSIVTTQPQANLQVFINQRLRWAGKLSHNTSLSTKLLGWFIITFQASYVAVILFMFTGVVPLNVALLLIFIKLIIEFAFLKRVTSFTKVQWRTSAFLSLQVLYPLYVVGIGLFSNFLSYQWKGQKYRV